jgi:hypothetical protein
MSTSFIEIVEAALPLQVEDVEYQDPSFVLSGQEWSLSLECPWRMRNESGQLWFSWSSTNTSDLVLPLTGRLISSISPNISTGDLACTFSDGTRLEVFADTDLDPWVLRIPNLILVGAASGLR